MIKHDKTVMLRYNRLSSHHPLKVNVFSVFAQPTVYNSVRTNTNPKRMNFTGMESYMIGVLLSLTFVYHISYSIFVTRMTFEEVVTISVSWSSNDPNIISSIESLLFS